MQLYIAQTNHHQLDKLSIITGLFYYAPRAQNAPMVPVPRGRDKTMEPFLTTYLKSVNKYRIMGAPFILYFFALRPFYLMCAHYIPILFFFWHFWCAHYIPNNFFGVLYLNFTSNKGRDKIFLGDFWIKQKRFHY